jgi:formylglycine-generating enzyme required for sulfatase activity
VHGMGQNGSSMLTLRREAHNARIQVNGATQRLYDRVYTLDYPFEGGVRHSGDRFRHYARHIRANEIDIIAHSLGGLVSRWAMEMNTLPAWGSSSGQISKFLTLGTPHIGVPQALVSQFPILNGVLQCTNQHLVDLSYGSRVVEDLRNSNPAYRGTFYYALAGNKPCCLTGNLLQNISNAFYVLQSHDGIVSVSSASSSTLASKGIYMGPGLQAAQYYNHYEMFEDASYVRREIISRMKEGRDGVTRPTMVSIAPGSFSMGSNNGVYVEQPVHTVTISRSFWISKYEITQAEYRSLMGNNPSFFQSLGSDTRPVENVSWNNAVAFCTQLNNQERAQGRLPAGYEFRLPTEAEWEYCCRAGTQTEWHTGTSLACGQATFAGPTCAATATNRVGQFLPNAWGLYDMHGYLSEWCADTWHDSYEGAPADGSAWTAGGDQGKRVLRSGSWKDKADALRSAARRSADARLRDDAVGLRCVLSKN